MSFNGMLKEEESKVIIEKAIDLGKSFFDTANIYGRGKTEENVGEALKD